MQRYDTHRISFSAPAPAHAAGVESDPTLRTLESAVSGHSAALDTRARENRPWRPEETAHGVDANGVAIPTIGAPDASTLPNGPGIPAAASHYAPAGESDVPRA